MSPKPSRPARPAPGRRRDWWVYLLRCGDGSLYAGATNDLGRRVAAHASGRGARYTRSRLPVALVHSERAADRGSALRREAALKRLTRAQKLALVARSARTRRRVPSPRPSPPRRGGEGGSRRGPDLDLAPHPTSTPRPPRRTRPRRLRDRGST